MNKQQRDIKIEDSKRLACFALFRELYNEALDVYGIIVEFIKNVIASKKMYSFTLTEMTELLNSSYGFDLPEAVVKTSIKRIKKIKLGNHVYRVIEKN